MTGCREGKQIRVRVTVPQRCKFNGSAGQIPGNPKRTTPTAHAPVHPATRKGSGRKTEGKKSREKENRYIGEGEKKEKKLRMTTSKRGKSNVIYRFKRPHISNAICELDWEKENKWGEREREKTDWPKVTSTQKKLPMTVKERKNGWKK